MRIFVTVMMALAISTSIPAQDSEKYSISFETLQLKKAGVLIGNYKSKQMVRHLGGGVKLVFIAKDPAENMTVEATTIDFHYDEANVEENTLTKMALNGDIVIRSQGVLIQSQKAIIDLDSMEADFIGYTEILRDGDEAPAQAERFTINFETGEMRMLDAFIPRIDLKSQKENEESPKKP